MKDSRLRNFFTKKIFAPENLTSPNIEKPAVEPWQLRAYMQTLEAQLAIRWFTRPSGTSMSRPNIYNSDVATNCNR